MIETLEPPEVVSVKNVQFWCKHTRTLAHSQSHKALQFVEYDCIKYLGNDEEFNSKYTFICLPLNTASEWPVLRIGGEVMMPKKPFGADYNSSEYKMFRVKEGVWTCNCQGWNMKHKRGETGEDGVACSHLLALFYCFKMKRFGHAHGAIQKEVDLDDEWLKQS